MQIFRLRCHNFEPNRPVGVVVKHIAIGAGGFGFDSWEVLGSIVKRSGYRCGRSGVRLRLSVRSRSFLKCGVSAVTMAAHKFFKKNEMKS